MDIGFSILVGFLALACALVCVGGSGARGSERISAPLMVQWLKVVVRRFDNLTFALSVLFCVVLAVLYASGALKGDAVAERISSEHALRESSKADFLRTRLNCLAGVRVGELINDVRFKLARPSVFDAKEGRWTFPLGDKQLHIYERDGVVVRVALEWQGRGVNPSLGNLGYCAEELHLLNFMPYDRPFLSSSSVISALGEPDKIIDKELEGGVLIRTFRYSSVGLDVHFKEGSVYFLVIE